MSKELRIYKPNNAGKGSALKLQQVQKKEYTDKNGKAHYGWHLFAEFASQIGKDENNNAKFGWRTTEDQNTGAILMKISELDAAKLLLVLQDEVEESQLYHDPNKAREESSGSKSSNIFKVKRGNNGYTVEVSSQAGKELSKIFIVIAWEEAVLVKEYLRLFIQRFYS